MDTNEKTRIPLKSPRHIIIAIDPQSREADHTIQWALDNLLDSNRDQVDLVFALVLDADFSTDSVADIPAVYDYQYLMEIEQQVRNCAGSEMGFFLGSHRCGAGWLGRSGSRVRPRH
ncbi:hypothetical protein NQZ79_g6564 [Umbelopsis isabellina]|nr:hypothetical protein NQZ79_g6564 [Umbelopsis isabellina]